MSKFPSCQLRGLEKEWGVRQLMSKGVVVRGVDPLTMFNLLH